MGKIQIDAFLSHLATHNKVSASTQRQALNAIVFLYRNILDQPIEDQLAPVKAKRHIHMVMTQSEVSRVIANMGGTHLLMSKILYGCGLRLMECVRLRDENLGNGFEDVDLPKAPVSQTGHTPMIRFS